MQFFYDGQIRRYITQMVRLMSNFSYKDGRGNLKTVPVMYGDITRQVAHIIKENSENKLPSVPRMAVYVTSLSMDRERTSDASYVNKLNIREREYDDNAQEYLNTQGKNYTVERLMPAPYNLGLNVDIWTSNTEQKLQIIEQILMLFRPSLEIQTTDNYVDWTSLTVVNLEDITFSNRSIPIGTESEIDIATLSFQTPIYISPPTKVKKLGVITNIITNIFDETTGSIQLGESTLQQLTSENSRTFILEEERSLSNAETGETENIVDYGQFPNDGSGLMDINVKRTIRPALNLASTQDVTWLSLSIFIRENTVQIIGPNPGGTLGGVSWLELFEAYPSCYQPGVSELRLILPDGSFIVGTFEIDPQDPTKILITWDEDTLPSNSVIEGPSRDINNWTTVDYIIDPLRWNPNQNKFAGLRLLLLGKIGNAVNQDGADGWKNNDNTDFIADENDIVEWDGNRWHIVMDSSDTSEFVYFTNLNTMTQYVWNGEYWTQSYQGEYSQGQWYINWN